MYLMQWPNSQDVDACNTGEPLAPRPAPLSAHPREMQNLDYRLGECPHVAMSYIKVNGYTAEFERIFLYSASHQSGQRIVYRLDRGPQCWDFNNNCSCEQVCLFDIKHNPTYNEPNLRLIQYNAN